MPHRLHLRIAIVDHLLDAGALDGASAIDPSEYHIGHGVRASDYNNAVIELIGLGVVSVGKHGALYLTEDGIRAAKPEDSEPGREGAD